MERVQPATLVTTIRIEQVRVAIGVLDGLVHRDDTPETHVFDLLVGEHDTDETGDFGVGSDVLPLGGFRTDVSCDAFVIREERALHDDDLGYDALGRLEVGRQEDLLGIVANVVAGLFQALDPAGTCGAVGRDREADDDIFFAPGTVGHKMLLPADSRLIHVC